MVESKLCLDGEGDESAVEWLLRCCENAECDDAKEVEDATDLMVKNLHLYTQGAAADVADWGKGDKPGLKAKKRPVDIRVKRQ